MRILPEVPPKVLHRAQRANIALTIFEGTLAAVTKMIPHAFAEGNEKSLRHVRLHRLILQPQHPLRRACARRASRVAAVQVFLGPVTIRRPVETGSAFFLSLSVQHAASIVNASSILPEQNFTGAVGINNQKRRIRCQIWKRPSANAPTNSGSPMVDPRAGQTSIG